MSHDLVIHEARVDGARVDSAIAGERIARIGADLQGPGLDAVPGARADLVVLDAETARDALREQAPRRWVLHGGRVVAETVREQRLVR